MTENIGSINCVNKKLLEKDDNDSEEILGEDSPEYENQLKLRRVLRQESTNFGVKFWLFSVIPMVLVTMFFMFTGIIPAADIGVCSPGYWVFWSLLMLILIGLGIYSFWYLRREQEYKVSIHYNFHETDT